MAVRSALVVPLALAFALSACAVHAKADHTQAALPQTLSVGSLAPRFAYHLSGGKSISSNILRGHPYVLWIMATWCSSCQGGTSVVAQHIGQLRTHDVRVIQLEAANDLGYPGPPLSTFRRAVGSLGRSPNWSWGELTDPQMAVLDPNGYPDIYYLIDRQGRLVEINGAPAATWKRIAKFAESG